MVRRRFVLALVAIAGCSDAPTRPPPRPTAPAQASRALLAEALSNAAADAERARTLASSLQAPSDDDAAALRALVAIDPDGDPDGDPDDFVGGVVGGIDPDVVAPAPPDDLVVEVLTEDDDLDPAAIRHHQRVLRMQARRCAGQIDTDDTITALVSLSAIGSGTLAVHVSGAGPLTDCLQLVQKRTRLPDGATVTFQLIIPPH